MTTSTPRRLATSLLLLFLAYPAVAGDDPGPFAQFVPPLAWQAEYWADPDAAVLEKHSPVDLVALVPTQAGLKFCRCPACGADEATDPLFWSPTRPAVVTCRRCAESFPNPSIPAQVEKKVPVEDVEVLPGVVHHYPYHAVPADSQRYPDERLYLSAKLDYEKREALARAALYAATRDRGRGQDASGKSDRFAALLLLRFAQVYPAYATHYDQPGEPKFLQPADLKPPYRRGYRTAKWEWTGNLEVPLNLVTAYAFLRDRPVWDEVGAILGDRDPKRTIEHAFFRPSAEFARRQPDESDEMSLPCDRGIAAVARLLGDRPLMDVARQRLVDFSSRGFYHDGTWRTGEAVAQRRVVRQLDGWVDRVIGEGPAPVVPMLELARKASSARIAETRMPEIEQASWPSPTLPIAEGRGPILLGGVGIARLSVGGPKDGLDLELRGVGTLGSARLRRQTLRVAVGGRGVLDDLDDLPPTADGFDLATASQNTVVVDGLNQRETPAAARTPCPGGRFLYFAADPDFQVAALDDPLAYPTSTTRYRQVVVAASGPKGRYAVSVFQVFGGLQHDQLFHGPAGEAARWEMSGPLKDGPESLLPTAFAYQADLKAEQGRWFVQAFGEFRRIAEGRAIGPSTATLASRDAPGIRLHLFGETPLTIFSALTPDPTRPLAAAVEAEAGKGRPSLVLRRRSAEGATLRSTFVTVFEPVGVGAALGRVGRVAARDGLVVLSIATADGPESLVVNPRPGTATSGRLADGRGVATDGLALRVGTAGLQLAGGTFGQVEGLEVRQARLSGRVLGTGRSAGRNSPGWFEVDAIPDLTGEVEGRTLLIQHGDGSTGGWTIRSIKPLDGRRVRIEVEEEPGFTVDPTTGSATLYQFPLSTLPGPHEFTISRMTRSGP